VQRETQGRDEERPDKHVAHQSNAHKKKAVLGSGSSGAAVQRLTVAAAHRNPLLVERVEFVATARFLVLSVAAAK
jgi:hypothetical protein